MIGRGMKFVNLTAVYLKNFKCYQGINECPVFRSDCEGLLAYLGDNGTGKSAILEGLDAYFSKRPRWLRNKESKKGAQESFVAPVFLVEASEVKRLLQIKIL